jgi:hypothetical protein
MKRRSQVRHQAVGYLLGLASLGLVTGVALLRPRVGPLLLVVAVGLVLIGMVLIWEARSPESRL